MTLTYKTRRRLALLILLVGMPIYVVVAVTLMTAIDRLPLWAEVPAYLILGLAWIAPFRLVFLGIGQPDPSGPDVKGPDPDAPVTKAAHVKQAEGSNPSA